MGVAERRKREKRERRASIVEAAEAVFLRKGLTLATMDEIAAEAEVSKGTLYLYFDSKDELYLALAVRSLGELLERFSEMPQQGSGLERLERLLRTYVQYAIEHSESFRVAMNWITSEHSIAPGGPSFQVYQRHIAEVFATAANTIDLGKRDGSIRADLDTAAVAIQLWSAMVGMLLLRMNAGEISRRSGMVMDFEAMMPSYLDLLLRGVRATEAA